MSTIEEVNRVLNPHRERLEKLLRWHQEQADALWRELYGSRAEERQKENGQ